MFFATSFLNHGNVWLYAEDIAGQPAKHHTTIISVTKWDKFDVTWVYSAAPLFSLWKPLSAKLTLHHFSLFVFPQCFDNLLPIKLSLSSTWYNICHQYMKCMSNTIILLSLCCFISIQISLSTLSIWFLIKCWIFFGRVSPWQRCVLPRRWIISKVFPPPPLWFF